MDCDSLAVLSGLQYFNVICSSHIKVANASPSTEGFSFFRVKYIAYNEDRSSLILNVVSSMRRLSRKFNTPLDLSSYFFDFSRRKHSL